MNTKITFHFILADNDLDGDNEAFTNVALDEICQLCIGHYGLFDGTEVKAKITNASIMDSCGVTKDGRRKRFIYAEAEFPKNEHGRKLISKILLEKPIASIACSALNRDKVADDVTMISNVTNFYGFSLRFDEEKEAMDKNELERRLEAAEKQNLGLLDEIQNLKAQLAKVRDEPEIPDKPDFEMDDKFYYLDSLTNDVEDSCIDNDSDAIDFNMFHTEEYAQEFRKKCLIIAMLLHCKWYLDRNFGNEVNDKFCVMYDHRCGIYTSGETYRYTTNDVIFSSEEAANEAAEWLNKHWKVDGNDA